MPDFSIRSYEKELLDRNDIPFEDIKRNMQELEAINSRLGGHRITLNGLKSIYKKSSQKIVSVCEVGCGGGDNLKVIDKWCNENDISAQFIGIDINKDCINYATENCKHITGINFITSDYRLVSLNNKKPDIIFSSLFCHHLNDEEFMNMLEWSRDNSRLGFFINDLHRNFLAYYSIKLLTTLFSKSYLVKNDAPLSVRRGFTKKELKFLLDKAGIKHYTIIWKWAFRWLVIVKNE
jgi:2-polyprenyl-3-methyl-5-hydroxy-6-metoxy-1,4-benzoquinol methylase